jgi:hypothetical protein
VPPPPPPFPSLKLAAAVIAVEAVMVFGYVGFLVYETTVHGGRAALLITIYFAVFAVALAYLGVALIRRKKWARSPMIVLQALLVAIGYYMLKAGLLWIGGAVALLAVSCIVLLFIRSTRDALGVR